MINTDDNMQGRAGCYSQQPAGYRAFISAPFDKINTSKNMSINSKFLETFHGRVRQMDKLCDVEQCRQSDRVGSCGVTYPTINRLENSHAKPSPLVIQQIEDLFYDMGKDKSDLREKLFPQEQ